MTTTSSEPVTMSYEDWIHYGMEQGWISPPYCDTHDTGWEWLRPEVQEAYERGEDPCVIVLQLLEAE